MKTIISLDKEDITTYLFGNNYHIEVNKELSIVFTPEAVEELLKDFNLLQIQERSKK